MGGKSKRFLTGFRVIDASRARSRCQPDMSNLLEIRDAYIKEVKPSQVNYYIRILLYYYISSFDSK